MRRGRRIGAIFVAVAVCLVLAVWIGSIVLRPSFPKPAQITQRMQQQAALTGGEQVYATHCAYCHDTGFAPSIAGRGFPTEAVRAWVRSGPAAMQSFTPAQVSDESIETVTRYIDSLPPVPEKKS